MEQSPGRFKRPRDPTRQLPRARPVQSFGATQRATPSEPDHVANGDGVDLTGSPPRRSFTAAYKSTVRW
jgi:hypothetical protein